jgi:hypothetical protein
MLHEFVTANRQKIIQLCEANVAKRAVPAAGPVQGNNGVPLFLEQLVDTLQAEQKTLIRITGSEPTPAPTKIGRSAALHGAEMLRRGFRVDQVVHDYGDVCQSVTALAVELDEPISTDEFRTLNRCLDNAIADAVAAFGAGHQSSVDHQTATWQQRLDDYAADQQRLVAIAIQSFNAIKTGNIGTGGATGALLDHALAELLSLADRILPEVLSAKPG